MPESIKKQTQKIHTENFNDNYEAISPSRQGRLGFFGSKLITNRTSIPKKRIEKHPNIPNTPPSRTGFTGLKKSDAKNPLIKSLRENKKKSKISVTL